MWDKMAMRDKLVIVDTTQWRPRYVYVCICVYMCIKLYICVYMCICVCIGVYVCICVWAKAPARLHHHHHRNKALRRRPQLGFTITITIPTIKLYDGGLDTYWYVYVYVCVDL